MKINFSKVENSHSNDHKLLNNTKLYLIERLFTQPILGLEFNILNDYSELEFYLEYLKQNKYNIPRFLLLNKNCIHDIIYSSDNIIKIDSFEIKSELNNYFCLSLLIMDNSEMVDYSFSFDFLNNINKFNFNQENKLTKILFSKVILEMVNHFKGLDEYDEEKYNVY